MMGTDVTYPPLDLLKPVADGVWIVDSGPMRAFGIPLPVRMTVLRLSDGSLILHSPTRLTVPLKESLAGIGTVRHLIAPNVAHWTFLAQWQAQFPDATTWAAPGLRQRGPVRRSNLRLDHDLGRLAPDAWSQEIEHILVRGAGGFCEVALFHVGSRTLVLTDLVQNIEPARLPALLRPAAHLAGVTAPRGRAPVYLRAIVRLKGGSAREAARIMVGLAPERVIFSHGRWFDRDGTAQLRRSLAWLLD